MTARLASHRVKARKVRAQLVILAANRFLFRDNRLRGPYGEPYQHARGNDEQRR